MSAPLFRAKYLVVLIEGELLPVLLPEKRVFMDPAALNGWPVVGGGIATLHTLGHGALGFTVESGFGILRVRPDKDPQLLDQHYLAAGTLHQGEPFTTRLP